MSLWRGSPKGYRSAYQKSKVNSLELINSSALQHIHNINNTNRGIVYFSLGDHSEQYRCLLCSWFNVAL